MSWFGVTVNVGFKGLRCSAQVPAPSPLIEPLSEYIFIIFTTLIPPH
jgi:hypothetical protein